MNFYRSVLPHSQSSLTKMSTSITSENAGDNLGAPVHHGRSLLWLSSDTTNFSPPINNVSHTCPLFINATESLR